MKIGSTEINLKKYPKAKIVIILPHFNDEIGQELLQNCTEELIRNEVKKENIKVVRVAGALEIPFAAQKIARQKNTDVIIALGVVIRGDTTHYELVTETTYQALMDVQLTESTPIIFGIITCENTEQAKIRAAKNKLNKGGEAAIAALLQLNI